jgi:hypothetical protein
MQQVQFVMEMANVDVENVNVVPFLTRTSSLAATIVNAMITSVAILMGIFAAVSITYVRGRNSYYN